ncbi:tRNA (adenosine(37)-N6)-threonylcarbamoyltransferase complex dimerization subunit type 1 TsaB [Parerythrobacter lacustris]|uniref:tRNA (Adenosine(37)-N6)-threonylcarbamoyltransferase complex dimerization subunit type 1 TsaB n=1 Tax=Parerythrobacter lacustris TaxID=2969984 RepID=A0ABT1XQ45_9SPHN|nr:tRNA (adenosine(37)-N6)-threonylcarbamoyltransferase complex dimerization subunit type 1 TsaB [Parerythrobacter lacustris]MCR2833362.1 tRNA (adenosine(37)-N6)-threonylcarbamoyltransferase complex dimerization subunit type 1 TsaB [Parerythrobacter lacustris]
MRTLAIDCATEACSVALFEDGALIAGDFAVLGRGHAEQLVPMIARLPGKGKAQRILVSRGPGSFTGVRIGVATARALAYAWGAECLGYPSLALVAAQARKGGAHPVTVCMHGGHGEWFVQDFAADGMPQDEARSLAPEAAVSACTNRIIAGNRSKQLACMFDPGAREVLELLPDAREACMLPGSLLSADASPLYGRLPDAKPQA